MIIGRLRRSLQFWNERREIIEDMTQGRYSVTETMERLEAHKQPFGQERSHVFSCRNGYAPCRCPFQFDVKKYVPLQPGPEQESTWRDLR